MPLVHITVFCVIFTLYEFDSEQCYTNRDGTRDRKSANIVMENKPLSRAGSRLLWVSLESTHKVAVCASLLLIFIGHGLIAHSGYKEYDHGSLHSYDAEHDADEETQLLCGSDWHRCARKTSQTLPNEGDEEHKEHDQYPTTERVRCDTAISTTLDIRTRKHRREGSRTGQG